MTTSQRHKTELKWHRRLMGIAVLVGIALGTYLAVWRPDLPMAQQPTGQEGPFRNAWGVPNRKRKLENSALIHSLLIRPFVDFFTVSIHDREIFMSVQSCVTHLCTLFSDRLQKPAVLAALTTSIRILRLSPSTKWKEQAPQG